MSNTDKELTAINKEIDEIKTLTDKIKASHNIDEYGFALVHLNFRLQSVKKRLGIHDEKEAKANATREKLTATFGEDFNE